MGGQALRRPLDGRVILVADDEPMLAAGLAAGLSGMGATVLTAGGGRHALAMARRLRLDAVITDLDMPDGNGLDLLRGLQALPGPAPRCFVCSGSEPLDALDREALGLSGYFTKPVSLRVLGEALARHLAS